jgi:hypothetical protein
MSTKAATSKQKPAGAMPAQGFGLPHLPLDPKWIEEHPCFFSDNPMLVRACMRMIVAAWRNAPAASLSANYASLGHVCGLDEQTLHENFEDLAVGWELIDGRLVHKGLKEFCDVMWSRHGEILGQFAIDAAAVAQSPDEFVLATQEPVARRTRGRHLLPKDWKPSLETVKKLEAMGFPEDEQDKLKNAMRNWADASNHMRNNWDAQLMSFAERAPKPIQKTSGVPYVPSRFGNLTHKGEIARSVNQSVMAQIRERQQ